MLHVIGEERRRQSSYYNKSRIIVLTIFSKLKQLGHRWPTWEDSPGNLIQELECHQAQLCGQLVGPWSSQLQSSDIWCQSKSTTFTNTPACRVIKNLSQTGQPLKTLNVQSLGHYLKLEHQTQITTLIRKERQTTMFLCSSVADRGIPQWQKRWHTVNDHAEDEVAGEQWQEYLQHCNVTLSELLTMSNKQRWLL